VFGVGWTKLARNNQFLIFAYNWCWLRVLIFELISVSMNNNKNMYVYGILRIFLAIGLKIILRWEVNWNSGASCIIDDNCILGGTRKATGIGKQQETTCT
jgi:hypothetical protein